MWEEGVGTRPSGTKVRGEGRPAAGAMDGGSEGGAAALPPPAEAACRVSFRVPAWGSVDAQAADLTYEMV